MKPEIKFPIKEYDDNNNIIHSKNSDGFEYWNKYDENNNIIHSKNSKGYEYWNEYNENNNIIHHKDSDGFEYWKEYDDNNNLIHSKNSNGFEYWNKYDENNNIIYSKNANGYEYWYEYDNNNNLIHYKDSEGYKYWNKYDNNNNIIYSKNSNGYEYWYNSNGDNISKKEFYELNMEEINNQEFKYKVGDIVDLKPDANATKFFKYGIIGLEIKEVNTNLYKEYKIYESDKSKSWYVIEEHILGYNQEKHGQSNAIEGSFMWAVKKMSIGKIMECNGRKYKESDMSYWESEVNEDNWKEAKLTLEMTKCDIWKIYEKENVNKFGDFQVTDWGIYQHNIKEEDSRIKLEQLDDLESAIKRAREIKNE